jgi:phospholipase/carboxylesterase
VMAIDTVLRFPLALGGIMALSGYIAHPDLLSIERHVANANVPIFLAHGLRDPVLPIKYGRENHRLLTMMGYAVEYHEYDTVHRINREETRDIQTFLRERISN